MNKLILLLLIFSVSASAGGEDGTGEPVTSQASSEANYQLICISKQNDEHRPCFVIEEQTDQ